MKILYFDLSMGAAGDMLTAALLGLLPDPEGFVSEFNALGIPRTEMRLETSDSRGVSGLRVHIIVSGQEEGSNLSDSDISAHHHAHSSLSGVAETVARLPLSGKLRQDVMDIYDSIARAEAAVHGRPVEQVHFHEVGALDAIADVTAVCMLMDRLSPDRVCASPVHVGYGKVRCAHGLLPVPAPATAELLLGIPSLGGEIPGELCTPTGAAILRHFVTSYGPQPLMSVSRIGRGLGARELECPNCLRVFLGETSGVEAGEICEISCNLDDMTGEALGFVQGLLLEAGALDAYTLPLGMKKSRPGVMLCCICHPQDTEMLSALILRHTTTLGVRINSQRRLTLERELSFLNTPLGPVRIKHASGKEKPEYDDLARIARAQDWTLAQTEAYVRQFEGKSNG